MKERIIILLRDDRGEEEEEEEEAEWRDEESSCCLGNLSSNLFSCSVTHTAAHHLLLHVNLLCSHSTAKDLT